MKQRLKTIFLFLIALVSGGVVLVSYFYPASVISELSTYLLRWAVIFAAVGLVVGLINLLTVHWLKISQRQTGSFNSAILLLFFLVTMIAGLVFDPLNRWSVWIYNSILIPVETSLLAILAIVLLYTATRLLYNRLNWFSAVFLVTVLIFLLSAIALPSIPFPGLTTIREWILNTWVLGGARGLLIGIALGTIATGLRLFLGADRPYEG